MRAAGLLTRDEARRIVQHRQAAGPATAFARNSALIRINIPSTIVNKMQDEPLWAKIGGDVFESFVIHQIDGLDLKGLHKALGLGIVIGIAPSAHRADETMFGQQVAIELGGVLRTTIRVVDAALWRLSYSDGRLQCRNSNAGIDRATNRVADYAA